MLNHRSWNWLLNCTVTKMFPGWIFTLAQSLFVTFLVSHEIKNDILLSYTNTHTQGTYHVLLVIYGEQKSGAPSRGEATKQRGKANKPNPIFKLYPCSLILYDGTGVHKQAKASLPAWIKINLICQLLICCQRSKYAIVLRCHLLKYRVSNSWLQLYSCH